jgi:hypothetical protein
MKKRGLTHPVAITAAVEGIVDEAVVRRIIQHTGGTVASIHGFHGKDHLKQSLGGYNSAARFAPWLVLMDLNTDAECAPTLRGTLLSCAAPMMSLRIAVRAVEAWLLADRERFARFLGVRVAAIPVAPEALTDPKQSVVQVASRCRRRDIRVDILPRPGSGRREGPGYASRMIEFVSDVHRGWRPDVASANADSLRRCLGALRTLAKNA